MKTRNSPVATLIAGAYYPLLVTAAVLTAVAAVRLLTDVVTASAARQLAIAGGLVSLPMFLLMLFNKPTGEAINAVQKQIAEPWPTWTWREMLFAPIYGDRGALVLSRIALAVFAVSAVLDQPAAFVAFAALAISTLLSFLLLGHPRSKSQV